MLSSYQTRTQQLLQSPAAPSTLYDLTTVINWCKQGKLKAYKTPGGHRRVEPKVLLGFLKEYQMPVPPDLEEKTRGHLKVLVVDDENELRRVMVRALKKNLPEAQTYEARDGFEAGKLVLDTLPDLVILDLNLPGIDGFRVCANIREDDRLKETRILAITGQNTGEVRQRILRAGADDFLGKPFEVKDLVEKVFRLLGVTRSLSYQTLRMRHFLPDGRSENRILRG